MVIELKIVITVGEGQWVETGTNETLITFCPTEYWFHHCYFCKNSLIGTLDIYAYIFYIKYFNI